MIIGGAAMRRRVAGASPLTGRQGINGAGADTTWGVFNTIPPLL